MAQTDFGKGQVISATDVVGTLPTADLVPSRGPGSKPVSPYLLNMPRFCRVIAKLTPVPGSNIRIEVWLPEQWNGKLLTLGNHGFAGRLEHGDMAMGLQRGYAVAGTDTGHDAKETDARFAVGNPVALEDFAWRATHEMTVAAKALVLRRYGMAARKAYFDACSNGGRQSMREVQQFPADYDGVIAGSTGAWWTASFIGTLAEHQWGNLGGGGRMTQAKLDLATRTAVATCDKLDGVADGVLADPTRCHWDPRKIQCPTGADRADCLTAAEAAVVVKMESPLKDPKTGKVISGGMPPGSESAWKHMMSLSQVTIDFYRYMVANDPKWSPDTADLIATLRLSEKAGGAGQKINSINPDISAFRKRGGKLIQYHGWNDPTMSPELSTRYYAQVIDMQPGPDRLTRTRDFYRLFMIPGMAHCYGGDGPVAVGALDHLPLPTLDADHDMLEALDRWVDKGVAPDRLIATQFATAARPQRQMPVCAYPQSASYAGGDADKAESFVCKAPAARLQVR
jgi:hypothetical protein